MATFHDHEERFQKLFSLSPSAVKMMETESYRNALETDEVDIEAVLEKAVQYLVQDLYEIGVELTVSLESLLENYYDLDLFLDLMVYISPATLYRRLRVDPKLRQVLETILHEGIDTEDSTVVTWVRYLGLGENPYKEELRVAAEDLIGSIQSTEQYDTVLENLLDLDGVFPTADINQEEDIDERYLAYLVSLDNRYMSALDLVKETIGAETVSRLKRHMQFYLQSLRAVDKFNEHAVMFVGGSEEDRLNDPNFLPFARKLKDHAVSSRFFLSYYKARNLSVTTMDAIGMVLYIYASTPRRNDYARKVIALRDTIAGDSVPNDGLTDAWRIAQLLLNTGTLAP